ncbi:MAG: isoprenylcysteine carboxylmethyltransferase family protein [Ignavibacteriae bacterium]|nr:isoprenylcysteine carboxylmethyltransferase family protein [Ignavibacteriota bacterium]
MSEPFDIRAWIFKNRSYTPLPFLLVMIVFAEPTLTSLLLGFAIVLLGESIRFWGVSIAGAETRTTGSVGGTYLITTGPFGHVRNPLYVGNMLMYAGVGVMSMALFPWLLIIACLWFLVQYSLIISREEEYLRGHFGAAYGEYLKNVPRLVPRLSPYRSAAPPPKHLNFAEGLASERRTLQAMSLVTLIIVARFVYNIWVR